MCLSLGCVDKVVLGNLFSHWVLGNTPGHVGTVVPRGSEHPSSILLEKEQQGWDWRKGSSVLWGRGMNSHWSVCEGSPGIPGLGDGGA